MKMYNNQLLRLEKSYKVIKERKTMPINEFYEDYVDFETTLKSCKECVMYDNNWSCPPFDNNIQEIWHKYENVDLILSTLEYDKFITNKTHTEDEIDTILHLTLFNEKTKLLQEIRNQTMEDDFTILSTGYCNLCPTCTRKDNTSCRYPNNRLHSVESVGGLVTKIAEDIFDTKLLWIDVNKGIIPEHLNLMMAVLY